ncbi:MAG: DUF4199 domain-containing protein [Spirosoma sp.]|nr:DUF4199 domain-containing protein [Spirosoma sp.]
MNEEPSLARVALKWGAILGVISIVFSLILFITNTVGNTGIGSISYLFTIGVLIMAMREFRTLNGGFMRYGQGLSIGALTAGISGLLSSLFSVFYTTVIDTGVMERMVETTRDKLEESGLPDEQIDAQMKIIEMFQSPGLLFIFGVIGSIFMGFLFSLVIAAIMKKEKTNVFE